VFEPIVTGLLNKQVGAPACPAARRAGGRPRLIDSPGLDQAKGDIQAQPANRRHARLRHALRAVDGRERFYRIPE
jgi:hypothetical protein